MRVGEEFSHLPAFLFFGAFFWVIAYTIIMIYFAADHRGFQLKEILKQTLIVQGYPIEDMGALRFDETDDYVDFVKAAVEKIGDNPGLHKGIFVCGSGHGMDMVANKYKNIRAVLCYNRYVAVQSRQHENANVLVLASDWVKDKEAQDIMSDWLNAEYTSEERHARRLTKISEIEKKNFKI